MTVEQQTKPKHSLTSTIGLTPLLSGIAGFLGCQSVKLSRDRPYKRLGEQFGKLRKAKNGDVQITLYGESVGRHNSESLAKLLDSMGVFGQKQW